MEPTPAAQVEKEYSAQHFGFDPSWLTENFAEDSLENLTTTLGKVKMTIEKKLAGKFEPDSLDAGFKKTEAKYCEVFEQIFQKLGPYLYTRVFKVPHHVLLKEDGAWDDLKPNAAKTRLAAANTEMEKTREKYKNLLYRRARLRGELESRRKVCTVQEEAILREAGLKEAADVQGMEDILDLVLYKRKQLAQNLNGLGGAMKKKLACSSSVSARKSKRARLDADLERYQAVLQ